MFRSKTLFVVGAGASQEVGLPTGKELRDTIASKVNIRFNTIQEQVSGDQLIMQALRRHVEQAKREHRPGEDASSIDVNSYLHAGWHISEAMPQALSIDNFIDAQQDRKIELCGKLAITRSILLAEKGSKLHFDPSSGHKLEHKALEQTWYNSFTQILAEGHRRDGLDRLFENVSFISFNYDRCVEHYLFHALQNYFRISEDEAADLLNGLEIHHPYGVIGNLPWQPGGGVPFGARCNAPELLGLSQRVKTFTERVDDAEMVQKMREAMHNAEVVVFLGFGFHPQNMELIKPPRDAKTVRVFATGKGISDSDCGVVEQQIRGHFDKGARSRFQVHLGKKLTCVELFGEYWRSLAHS